MTHNTAMNIENPWGHYERLRPDAIDRILAKAPIAFIPWGAIEWHSYHNPIGLDGLIARGLCDAVARETGGVVLPSVYVATDTIKPLKGFRHSIEHSPDTVAAICMELLEGLVDEGFRVIVILTGHCGGRHVEELRKIAGVFSAQTTRASVWALPCYEPVEELYPANHAARGETSYQMYFDPDLVDLGRLPPDRVTTLDEDGVWGEDPRLASVAEGEAMVREFVRRVVPRVLEMQNSETK